MGVVSALRETSVVYAAIIGGVFLKEPLTARRVTSCLAITSSRALARWSRRGSCEVPFTAASIKESTMPIGTNSELSSLRERSRRTDIALALRTDPVIARSLFAATIEL